MDYFFNLLVGQVIFLIPCEGKFSQIKSVGLCGHWPRSLLFFAEIQQGVGLESLTTFIVGFIPLCVFIASFFNKKAQWKLYPFDFACGFLALGGLILWMITRIGNIAIFLSISADALATVPIITKSYSHPESESYLIYFFQIINSSIALLVIKNWNFQNYAFPFYLLLNGLVLFCLIKFQLGKKIHGQASV